MTLAVFPSLDGLEWNITRKSEFKTSVFESLSGKESRVKLRQTPKTTFKLSYEFLIENQDEQQMTELLSFMLNRAGSYEAFLYTDKNDNTVTDHYCGYTNGLTFQLKRGVGTVYEPVENLNGIPSFTLDNVLQTSGYTVSETGLITFVADPGVRQVRWTGSYYYRCRFLQDGYDFTQLMKDLHECKDIEFIGAVSNKV